MTSAGSHIRVARPCTTYISVITGTADTAAIVVVIRGKSPTVVHAISAISTPARSIPVVSPRTIPAVVIGAIPGVIPAVVERIPQSPVTVEIRTVGRISEEPGIIPIEIIKPVHSATVGIVVLWIILHRLVRINCQCI